MHRVTYKMLFADAYNIAEAATSSGAGPSENFSVSDAFGSA